MTVCKYFQQGICRFGNRCRFEHVYVIGEGDGGGGGETSGVASSSGTSVFNRNKLGGQHSTSSFFSQAVPNLPVNSRPSATTPDTRDLVQMVISELMQSERGGQWPLSCFAPFKEQGCFPGLEDHSPEELRYLMYEAVKTGNLEECTRKIKELYERNSTVRKQIMNPTAEICSVVEKLFKGQKIESMSSSLFASPLGSSGNSIISPNPSLSTNFTFSLSPGGDSNVPNNFGSSQPIFGNSSGLVTHSQSIFAQNPLSTNQNMFSNVNQPSAVPAFANTPHPSAAFQSPAGNFNSPLFNEQNKSVFGGNTMNQSKGIFGGTATNWNQAHTSVSEDSVYTALSELSDDEKNAFSLKTFTMGKVPIKAPAKELCL
ncbi:nucleoporin NUP42 [Anabrus simplex]|uniref:nucleoporin NUP42 n=1 Tax=Anabrus simplex TaxID=316456 RepID=UPI0035A2F8D0